MTFTKALSFIKGVLGSAGVLVPIVIGLMTSAENAMGDGTGALKKAAVTAGVVGFTDSMKEISTGGQKETWEQITPDMVSGLIDTVATVANGISKVSGGEIIFDDSRYEMSKLIGG